MYTKSTLAHIIPKIAFSFDKTQLLLSKDRKHLCATIVFLCARIGNISAIMGELVCDVRGFATK
jgi:hypothetical protein